jgi:hypothetical protein
MSHLAFVPRKSNKGIFDLGPYPPPSGTPRRGSGTPNWWEHLFLFICRPKLVIWFLFRDNQTERDFWPRGAYPPLGPQEGFRGRTGGKSCFSLFVGQNESFGFRSGKNRTERDFWPRYPPSGPPGGVQEPRTGGNTCFSLFVEKMSHLAFVPWESNRKEFLSSGVVPAFGTTQEGFWGPERMGTPVFLYL